MSPEDDLALYNIGETLYYNSATFSTGFLFYGIYIILFVICMYKILNRPGYFRTRSAKITFLTLIILFISTTTQFVVDMAFVLLQIKGYLLRPGINLADRQALWLEEHTPLLVIDTWPSAINIPISDCIVLWRAWALYPANRVARGVVALIASADVVLFLVAQYLATLHASAYGSDTSLDQGLYSATLFVSFGANLAGTGFIAAKAWEHYRATSGAFQAKQRRTYLTRVFMVFVEGGVLFALMQLVYAIIEVGAKTDSGPMDMARQVLSAIMVYLGAIFPTATIIIVSSQNSIVDYTISSSMVPHHQPTIAEGLGGAIKSTGGISLTTIQFALGDSSSQHLSTFRPSEDTFRNSSYSGSSIV